VHGNVLLTLDISDPAGVMSDSVMATINKTLYTLSSFNVNGTTYTKQFDTRSFGTQLTELTINITAIDNVGNISMTSLLVRLDNVPPRLSLDPPWLREGTVSGGNLQCSDAFDPVGERATNDLQRVTVSSLYRALVVDETNTSPGELVSYVAGVNPDSVVLYAQDPSIPLLKDTGTDGICDEINSVLPQGVSKPVELTLSAVTPRGTSYFSTAPNFSDSHNMALSECTAGTAPSPPSILCPATEITRVIPQPIEGLPPGIFAHLPTNGTTGACTGNTWELLQNLPEGWACLAVRAEDNRGNVGVSRPLRVCLDDEVGTPACDPVHDTPPTCTDGCTPPADFAPNQTWIFQ